ncbi:hypothetical protein BLL52_4214 [Rhodoferax antarcticus ANT.BR]|uniref:Uncharacterized protein n=2 Tax=Rhodoferax antarcticus TaxID=81479 RepID=A0A1Q8Y900_9BURK|nr:hypothetical protein BLL52_4214 [Rhodoferax antarcticus ANT.BR]
MLGYNKQFDNIQLVFKGAHVPNQGDEPRYSNYCRLRIEKSVADEMVTRSASLVDESKIFGE